MNLRNYKGGGDRMDTILILIKWGWLMGLIPCAIGMVAMFFIYSNNAKRFKALQEKARQKGKTLEELVK